MSTQYHVYGNGGAGGPVDYATVLDTVSTVNWTSPPLNPGAWLFGVRAFDTSSGSEERNTDASVSILVGPTGTDLSGLPPPPQAVRAVATAGGGCRVEWSYPYSGRSLTRTRPIGFHAYVGPGGSPSYGASVGTVRYAVGLSGRIELPRGTLSDGVVYGVAVRGYNAFGEESNAIVALVTGNSAAPASVAGLTATVV